MENLQKEKEYSIETDPLFKPIAEDKKKQIDEAVEKHIRSLSLDEIVDKDDTKVPGQNYALISIVSPQSNQKSEQCCLKIKGVFSTLDEANKYAEMLQKIDQTFDIYVVEMYSWLLIPPDPTQMDQKFLDGKLNEIISGHRENQIKSKMYFEERKRELMDTVSLENKEENNEKTTDSPDISDNSVPGGIEAESSVNIAENKNEMSQSNESNESNESPTPSDLMNSMVNEIPIEKPSKEYLV